MSDRLLSSRLGDLSPERLLEESRFSPDVRLEDFDLLGLLPCPLLPKSDLLLDVRDLERDDREERKDVLLLDLCREGLFSPVEDRPPSEPSSSFNFDLERDRFNEWDESGLFSVSLPRVGDLSPCRDDFKEWLPLPRRLDLLEAFNNGSI